MLLLANTTLSNNKSIHVELKSQNQGLVSRLKRRFPYVDEIISLRSGYWSMTKRVTGTQASGNTGITSNGILRSIVKSAVEKATSIAAMEKNIMERPKIIFLGSETRKSSKEYLEVRIVRNIRTEVQEAKKDSVSAIVKIMKRVSDRRRGSPEESSVPPGTVNMAWNVTVAMRAATKLHAEAVYFIHSSASLRSGS